MNLIHCLLIGGLLVLVNGDDFVPTIIKSSVDEYFNYGGYDLTESNVHRLQLLRRGELGRSATSLVWKGIYNERTNVAIKIFFDQQSMNEEIIVYQALNAIDDPNIENHNIPKVYYYGNFLGAYHAIAMSLFDGTLSDRYENQPNSLSSKELMNIFLETVKGLEYLESRNVVHNDIKPDNLFYRGRDIFIGDFNLASLNGSFGEGGTFQFASSNLFAGKKRTAKDDLESVVYSLWYLAGLPVEPCTDGQLLFGMINYRPEGYILAQNLGKGKKYAQAKLMKKCKFFKNAHVRRMFEEIWNKVLLNDDTDPNYTKVTKILETAISGINRK